MSIGAQLRAHGKPEDSPSMRSHTQPACNRASLRPSNATMWAQFHHGPSAAGSSRRTRVKSGSTPIRRRATISHNSLRSCRRCNRKPRKSRCTSHRVATRLAIRLASLGSLAGMTVAIVAGRPARRLIGRLSSARRGNVRRGEFSAPAVARRGRGTGGPPRQHRHDQPLLSSGAHHHRPDREASVVGHGGADGRRALFRPSRQAHRKHSSRSGRS